MSAFLDERGRGFARGADHVVDRGVVVRRRQEEGLELGRRQVHAALEHRAVEARERRGVRALDRGVVAGLAFEEERGAHRAHARDRCGLEGIEEE